MIDAESIQNLFRSYFVDYPVCSGKNLNLIRTLYENFGNNNLVATQNILRAIYYTAVKSQNKKIYVKPGTIGYACAHYYKYYIEQKQNKLKMK